MLQVDPETRAHHRDLTTAFGQIGMSLLKKHTHTYIYIHGEITDLQKDIFPWANPKGDSVLTHHNGVVHVIVMPHRQT
jgi:hypothetical protein